MNKKVLLVNIDSVIPNFALEKLRVYHEQQNDKIYRIKDSRFLPFTDAYDRIYVSCVFDYNKHRCKKWRGIAEIGGSGYSLKKCLPVKIERIKPKMNFGFTTRGCIRNCPFCIVQQKEGKIRVVGDIYDLWDGKSKDITLLDNNILAAPEHFLKVCSQLKKENLRIDFNQGLDHRLLTDEICNELFSLSYQGSGRMRFAFDHISYKKSVLKALEMLKRHGLTTRQSRWYVYVGVDDTVETVLERVNILRDANQIVFVMRDRKVQDNPDFKKIYDWSCDISCFAIITFDRFIDNYVTGKDNRPNLF